jgi:hypothetical protein
MTIHSGSAHKESSLSVREKAGVKVGSHLDLSHCPEIQKGMFTCFLTEELPDCHNKACIFQVFVYINILSFQLDELITSRDEHTN